MKSIACADGPGNFMAWVLRGSNEKIGLASLGGLCYNERRFRGWHRKEQDIVEPERVFSLQTSSHLFLHKGGRL